MRIGKDNRGLSLLELLAVIAIISIAGTVTIWGLNTLSGRPAQQTAQKLIYSMERHRISTMGKVDAYYTIRIDGTGKVVCEEGVKNSADPSASYSVTTSELGTKRVSIYVMDTGSSTLQKLNPGESRTFKFSRESGGFTDLPCSEVRVASGTREIKIKFVKVTGKVYLE